ncbi:hypothetical protein ASE01_06815 [Nocardioides sp. Root190]|uniref:hypothetical protein n=1 Tax=Nocardioides sp. Root190 TaxID=1736488 RepID=UPI0006F87D4C|nr:hypothetical protein [Nocardioides sp. Root190]KRB77888.1 hypothetical protein ASE01_06815 [Nocardioides sp. Root190]
MSDLEQQLSATLAGIAKDAPSAVGLADAARRRHRVRRQRRLAAGGALAAVVVIAGGVAVAQRGDDAHVAKDPADGAPGWQTISSGDARAAVPPDWSAHTCEPGTPVVHGPTVDEACVGGVGAVIAPQLTRERRPYGELVSGDGGWLGYVNVGEEDLRVFHEDRELVRRVLATGRLEGQPVVDAEQWVSFERDGLTYEVPAWWGVGEDGDRSDYSVCLTPAVDGGSSSEQRDPATFVFSETSGPQGTVVVTAPTQAVAELVMATVEVGPDATPGECAPEDFMVGLLPPEGGGNTDPVEEQSLVRFEEVQFDGITLDVPLGWSLKETCGRTVEITPGTACNAPLSGGAVLFYDESLFDPAMGQGEIVGGSGEPWVGYVLRGDYAVYVAHPERGVVEAMLDLVR